MTSRVYWVVAKTFSKGGIYTRLFQNILWTKSSIGNFMALQRRHFQIGNIICRPYDFIKIHNLYITLYVPVNEGLFVLHITSHDHDVQNNKRGLAYVRKITF